MNMVLYPQENKMEQTAIKSLSGIMTDAKIIIIQFIKTWHKTINLLTKEVLLFF